jgi:hypothetical protein
VAVPNAAGALRAVDVRKVLGVDAYRELLPHIPTPTAEQTSRFADFVARAHSWYKHLPLFPPGAPFCFFLDPHAGEEMVVTRDRCSFRDTTQLFHHCLVPTAEYHERYGYWQFATTHAPAFACGNNIFAKIPPGAETDAAELANRFGPDGCAVLQHSLLAVAWESRWIPVPEDLLDRAVLLTGLVHEQFKPRTGFPDGPGDGMEAYRALAAKQPMDAGVLRYAPFVDLAKRHHAAAETERQVLRRELDAWHRDEREHQLRSIESSLQSVLAALAA